MHAACAFDARTTRAGRRGFRRGLVPWPYSGARRDRARCGEYDDVPRAPAPLWWVGCCGGGLRPTCLVSLDGPRVCGGVSASAVPGGGGRSLGSISPGRLGGIALRCGPAVWLPNWRSSVSFAAAWASDWPPLGCSFPSGTIPRIARPSRRDGRATLCVRCARTWRCSMGEDVRQCTKRWSRGPPKERLSRGGSSTDSRTVLSAACWTRLG